MTTILLVGGADTGRAPMAAALLRRRAKQAQLDWQISSAGVLGHDDAPPEIEARDAMAHLGLDISQHTARSIDEALAGSAALLVALDSGIARVLRGRFPEQAALVQSLGELAGRARDVPDPFRMQMGAWLTYAGELEALLEAALPRMRDLLPAVPATASTPAIAQDVPRPERAGTIRRMLVLLDVAAAMPQVLDWPAARAQLEADLAAAAQPLNGSDVFTPIYADLARAALALSAAPPTPGQAAALRAIAARLDGTVQHTDIAWLSGQMAGWAAL